MVTLMPQTVDSFAAPVPATAQRIINVAASIISEHGEANLRINDVCDAAGLTATTLYSFFDDREHLVCATLHQLFASTSFASIREFQSLVIESTSSDGFQRVLHGVADNLLTSERRRLRRIRLHALAGLRHRPALQSAVSELLRNEITQFASWIERANTNGLISVSDPTAVAAWALSHTVAHTALDGDGVTSIDPHWDDVWRWALSAVVLGSDRPFPARPRSENRPAKPVVDRHPTAVRIINWAANRIDAVGESAFRAEHLPPEIAKSTTPIYRYFGTRENLVSAAQAERFARSVVSLAEAADHTDLEGLVVLAFSDGRRDDRAHKVEAIAATLGRPDVAQAIADRRDANFASIAASLSAKTPGVDLYDAVRLGASLLTSLAVVELLDLGIEPGVHRSISLPLLNRALATSTS